MSRPSARGLHLRRTPAGARAICVDPWRGRCVLWHDCAQPAKRFLHGGCTAGSESHAEFFRHRQQHRRCAHGPEELREQFLTDTLSATAVYCLPRDGVNTWKPSLISYNPSTDEELDTPQKFRTHIIAHAGVSSSLYRDYRNPLNDGTAIPKNASIFVLGYSKYSGYLKVSAIYDIDIIPFTGTTEPNGTYASVKRYADAAASTTPSTLTYMGGYEVFFPPSVPSPTSSSQWSTDGFAPLFITIERASRLALRESPTTIDRFKRAYERPFYFIWWPDPAARHLGAVANTLPSTDPRQAYNHMAGRSAFMFTVPMFPAL